MSLYTSTSRTASEVAALRKAYRNVQYAQKLLLNPSLNHRYRAISYLRLCCSAIVQYRSQGTDLAPELDAKQPYLKLLKALYRYDACWITKCEISHEGRLVSSDSHVNRSLRLLQRCVVQISFDYRELKGKTLAPQPVHALT